MLTHVLKDHLAFLRGPKTRKGVVLCSQLRHYIIYEKCGRNESPAKSYLVRRYLFIHVEDSVSLVRDWRKLEHLKSEPWKHGHTNNSGPFITHT